MKKNKNSLINEINQRIEKKKGPPKSKRTLVLTDSQYIEFEKICRKKNTYPSLVIDEFIALYVSSEGGKV